MPAAEEEENVGLVAEECCATSEIGRDALVEEVEALPEMCSPLKGAVASEPAERPKSQAAPLRRESILLLRRHHFQNDSLPTPEWAAAAVDAMVERPASPLAAPFLVGF